MEIYIHLAGIGRMSEANLLLCSCMRHAKHICSGDGGDDEWGMRGLDFEFGFEFEFGNINTG